MGNSARSRRNLRSRSASWRPISSGGGFQDVANAFGLDPAGDIAGLLARRDTWSGRSVLWPVAGTDLKMPVDLAALPVYDRNRNFEGFRGFGVARTGDASSIPRASGWCWSGCRKRPSRRMDRGAQRRGRHGGRPERTRLNRGRSRRRSRAEPPETAAAGEAPADPFRGEKPALSVAPRRTAASPTR